MGKFKVGDVLRCVNATASVGGAAGEGWTNRLYKGYKYIVTGVFGECASFVGFKETGDLWWSAERFELAYGPSPLNKAGNGLIEAPWGVDVLPTYEELKNYLHDPDQPMTEELKKDISFPDWSKEAYFGEWQGKQTKWQKKAEAEEELKWKQWKQSFPPLKMPDTCLDHKLRICRVVEVQPGRGTLWFQCPNCKAGLNIVSDIDGIEWPSYVEFIGLLKKVKIKEEEEPEFRLIRV